MCTHLRTLNFCAGLDAPWTSPAKHSTSKARLEDSSREADTVQSPGAPSDCGTIPAHQGSLRRYEDAMDSNAHPRMAVVQPRVRSVAAYGAVARSTAEDESLDLHSIVAKIRTLEHKVAQLEADGSQRLDGETQLKVRPHTPPCAIGPCPFGDEMANKQAPVLHIHARWRMIATQIACECWPPIRRRCWQANTSSLSSSTACWRKSAIACNSCTTTLHPPHMAVPTVLHRCSGLCGSATVALWGRYFCVRWHALQ